jgi:hypothetical protein
MFLLVNIRNSRARTLADAFCQSTGVCRDGQSFDQRTNIPGIGRILMARGREAFDVAMVSSFGPKTLESFRVLSDEIAG